MSDEEKRAEVFEVLEPLLRTFWKKYKYNQALQVRILLALMNIEYLTTDLLLKIFKGQSANTMPANIERLVPLYEKLSELNGKLTR